MRKDPGIAPPVFRSRGRRSHYDVIVIGSGAGGASAAGILARHGRRVLVLEKNDKVGGILASYTRDGFKIDLGSHLIARGKKGPIGRALRLAGLDRPSFLTASVPLHTRGIFETVLPRERTRLPGAMLRAVEELGLSRDEIHDIERLVVKVALARSGTIATWDRLTLHDLILRYTRNPAAYFLLAFLASIFFVLPPWDVSAGEAMLALRRLVRDWSLSYVEGGMDSIPHALLQRVVEADGDVVTRSRAARIERRGDELIVGTREGAEYRAPFVIAALAPQTLPDLLTAGTAPPEWIERLRSIRSSGNAWQLKLALRRPLVREGCIIGGVSRGGLRVSDLSIDLMRSTVEALSRGKITDPTPVYAPVPTNFDPSLAPEGRQLIVASIYGSAGTFSDDSPERWERHCLAMMARVIPGLQDELLFHEFIPIPAIGRWMNRPASGAISNGQYPGQVGRDRLPITTPVQGLCLAGDGAGGRGIGTELAATSGIEAAFWVLNGGRQ
jgi:prolycopene isomerase